MRQALDLVSKLLEAEPSQPPGPPQPGSFRDFLRKSSANVVVPAAYETVLEYAPAEFVRAFRAGREAEWNQEDFGGTDNWPSYDDDRDDEGENPWSERFYYFNYRTEGRKLYAVVMEGDLDGNHDYVDEAEVGTQEAEDLEREYGMEGWNQAMRRYWEWVVDRKEDPLGYINVPKLKTTKHWLAGFVKEDGKLKLYGLRQVLDAPPSPPTVKWPEVLKKAAKSKEWRAALEYCGLDEFGYCEATEEDIRANHDEKSVNLDDKGRLVVRFSTESTVVKSNKAFIVKAAKNALRELQGNH